MAKTKKVKSKNINVMYQRLKYCEECKHVWEKALLKPYITIKTFLHTNYQESRVKSARRSHDYNRCSIMGS